MNDAVSNKIANEFLTLSQVDSVEYDSTHLWECQIDGAPSPFDKWFPAQSVDEPTKGVSVSSISFGLEEINVLNTYNALTFRMEIIDDDKATLETWLRDWQKSITHTTNGWPYCGFNYLDDCLKSLKITKYNYQKVKIYTHEYFVLPTGSINVPHMNEPALKVLTVNFAIFGGRKI